MSYYNHRNYQLDQANRQRAMAAQQQAQNIRNQAAARANRMSRDWQGSLGDPRATVGSMNNMLSRENSGHYAEMANRQLDGQQAYANALDNEVTQMQDRMADMGENAISSKNRSDEMAYNLQREKAHLANQLGQQQNKSLQGLSNSLGSMNFDFEQPEMPNTDLYDNDGERVGGSQYGNNSLFAKTGIKNSLTRA
jgi:hypothetical protein